MAFEGENSYELFDSRVPLFSSGTGPAQGTSFSGTAVVLVGFCSGGTVELLADGQGAFAYVINNDFNGGGAGNGWNASPAATFTTLVILLLMVELTWMGDNTAAPRQLKPFRWMFLVVEKFVFSWTWQLKEMHLHVKVLI